MQLLLTDIEDLSGVANSHTTHMKQNINNFQTGKIKNDMIVKAPMVTHQEDQKPSFQNL